MRPVWQQTGEGVDMVRVQASCLTALSAVSVTALGTRRWAVMCESMINLERVNQLIQRNGPSEHAANAVQVRTIE